MFLVFIFSSPGKLKAGIFEGNYQIELVVLMHSEILSAKAQRNAILLTRRMTILIVVSLQVCLVNDPRNPYNTLLTVEYLSNMVNGRLVLYNNQPVEVLKKLAAASLKDNEVIKLWIINLFYQVK